MTIPLDRLYQFLDDIVDDNLIIYRWYTNGSKLLDDIHLLKKYNLFDMFTIPIVLCHDQEPTDYYLYSEKDRVNAILKVRSALSEQKFEEIYYDQTHIDNYIQEIVSNKLNIYNNYILLHSEKNSKKINEYVQHGAVPVYYFSHALIARDWFRYAAIDPLIFKKNVKKDFLIYQRSWSGSREYRLKFFEMLINSDIYKQCLSSFNPVDSDHHYHNHQYKNSMFCVERKDLELYFPINNTPSWASADYNIDDYNQTRFEVVLETLFDDQRWHLTEKIFRPIVCKQPFILVSTPGALSYLKSYGFKTFGDYIDESYDNIQDPVDRLDAVLNTMRSIASMATEEKELLTAKLQNIVEFNKNWFFSQEFFNLVIEEYKSNLSIGLDFLKTQKGACLDRWNLLKSKNITQKFITDQEYQKLLQLI